METEIVGYWDDNRCWSNHPLLWRSQIADCMALLRGEAVNVGKRSVNPPVSREFLLERC
ncbi:hypothetical protein J6590_001072 [Homalodisca vitripennis]|nr:hypothetical protein J6590_001072 [Homalodisca vitripennis]